MPQALAAKTEKLLTSHSAHAVQIRHPMALTLQRPQYVATIHSYFLRIVLMKTKQVNKMRVEQLGANSSRS